MKATMFYITAVAIATAIVSSQVASMIGDLTLRVAGQ